MTAPDGAPLVETGRMNGTKVMPERRTTCIVCHQALTHIRQIVCHPGECRRIYQRMIRKERRATWANRRAPRGRQCADCLAYDHETSFNNLSTCDACLARIGRVGRCERPHVDGTPGRKCQAILRGGETGAYCPSHDPPAHWIEVLWTCDDGRMRRLWRRIDMGKVSLDGRLVLVRRNPLSVTVRASAWVSVRA